MAYQYTISKRTFLKGTLLSAAGLMINPALYAQTPSPFIIGACSELKDIPILLASGACYLEPPVYDFIIPDDPEELFEQKLVLVKQSGLKTPVCNSFIRGSLKSVGPDHVKADVLAYAETTFRRAQIAGVTQIVYGSGGSRTIPDGFSRDEALKQFIELLTDMAPLAQKYVITICLEPLRHQECNFINTLKDGTDILDAVNHPNAMLVCDFYHVTQEGRGVSDVYAAGKYIRHVHIAKDKNRAVPGTAGDDFKPFLKALTDIGYNGNISLECNWTNKATEMPLGLKTMREQANS